MTWNYRVLKTISKGFKGRDGKWHGRGVGHSIREVYYNDEYRPLTRSSEDIAPYGETLEELRGALLMMLTDTYLNPVMTSKTWKRKLRRARRTPGYFDRIGWLKRFFDLSLKGLARKDAASYNTQASGAASLKSIPPRYNSRGGAGGSRP